MRISIHQTHHTVAAFDDIFKYLKQAVGDSKEDTLHLLPELFLTGYPLQDLCLQRSFIDAYLEFQKEINDWSTSLQKQNTCFLFGGLDYQFCGDTDGVPRNIKNVIYKLIPGQKIEAIYTKKLLPNYDIFDEEKYFTKGDKTGVLNFCNHKIALLICEDMWHSSVHQIDPVSDLESLNQKFDLVVNLSASPFNLHKNDKRTQRSLEIANRLNAPYVYVNRVGGEDEILFDGNSFCVDGTKEVFNLKSFQQDMIELECPIYNGEKSLINSKIENTWEGLFSANLIDTQNGHIPKLKPLDDNLCQSIVDALCFGVQEYAKKSYFKKFVVALSGGLDSALVLALLKLSLKKGQELEAIFMPSQYTRDISYDASKEMCKRINIPMHVIPIMGAHNYFRDMFKEKVGESIEGLTDENIQSRLRGLLLYARSNQSDALVINTSNKSELAVGYSTIYGDSVGAISLLGDLYKSEVFDVSRYINKKYGEIIPVEIIDRPPSAELRADQEDTDSLPPYDRMDAILEGILSYRLSGKKLVELGHDPIEVETVLNLYRKTEYKRIQFCPIIKLKSKSFGFGYRVPITKDSTYYMKS